MTTIYAANSTWHTSAPCRSADPDAWFPEIGEATTPAKTICASCPYRQLCLEEAIAWGPSHGWWGGKSAREIRRIRVERGLEGRPERTRRAAA